MIDVGGESTRPGAEPVSEDEELRRLVPVIEGLVGAGVAVSVDTYKAGVARRALEAGAVVVNDVTGFRDPRMVATVAHHDCGVVVMHMKGTPADMHVDPVYEDVVAEVESYLLDSVRTLEEAGVNAARIAIDPGIGFGKQARHSLTLLSNIGRLAEHGMPVMVGTSRKGFLGRVTGDDSRTGRYRATAFTTALAYAHGATLFRGSRCLRIERCAQGGGRYRGQPVMGRMVAGLKPRGFTWVITDRLAVSDRVGGSGFQHRRVRREEEITWLVEEAQINTIVSMLPGNQNLAAYRQAGIATYSVPMSGPVTRHDVGRFFATLDQALARNHARVLIHRETIDDTIGGLLGGYLVDSGMVDDPILALALIQQILGRALGPEGRSLIPEANGN